MRQDTEIYTMSGTDKKVCRHAKVTADGLHEAQKINS
jgi:hypothetical protein